MVAFQSFQAFKTFKSFRMTKLLRENLSASAKLFASQELIQQWKH